MSSFCESLALPRPWAWRAGRSTRQRRESSQRSCLHSVADWRKKVPAAVPDSGRLVCARACVLRARGCSGRLAARGRVCGAVGARCCHGARATVGYERKVNATRDSRRRTDNKCDYDPAAAVYLRHAYIRALADGSGEREQRATSLLWLLMRRRQLQPAPIAEQNLCSLSGGRAYDAAPRSTNMTKPASALE